MNPVDAVRARFEAVNGRHAISAADETYIRSQFHVLDPSDPAVGRRWAEPMLRGELPLPSYVLDGAWAMYATFEEIVDRAAAPGGLRGWYAASWDDAPLDVALAEWDGLVDGQQVCLRQMTPENLRRKSRLVAQIRELLPGLDGSSAPEMTDLVDELDELEPAFADYDRQRFGGPTSREVSIEAPRARLRALATALRRSAAPG